MAPEQIPLRKAHAGPADVTVVTRAGISGTADRKLRQRRYVITQLVRISCFLLAVVLPVALWVKLLLIVGAFVLPMMGVVAANAGPVITRHKEPTGVEPLERSAQVAIKPGRTIDQEN